MEDVAALARHVARPFEVVWPVVFGGTLAGAREVIRDCERFSAVTLDVRLPDGVGTDLLDQLLERQPYLRILITTGCSDNDLPNLAQRSGVEFLWKPFEMECVTAFARRTAVSEHVSDGRVCRHIATVAGAAGLSVRETEILALAVCALKEHQIAEILGIKESTVNTHGRHAALKLGKRNLAQAAWDLVTDLREGPSAQGHPSHAPVDLTFPKPRLPKTRS